MGAASAPARGGDEGEPGRWQVRRLAGAAADLHARPWPDPVVPTVTFLEVTAPALVLGSTQSSSLVYAGRAAAAGVEVVRRHSGGGAVLLSPGDVLWADVVVPAGDRLSEDDVGRAFWWLGEVWAEALSTLGVADVAWHRRPVSARPGNGVCFAGLAAGEVTVGGRKVVGLCQRRRRAGALFQCAGLLSWHPGDIADLLGVDPAPFAGAAAGLGLPAALVERAFVAALAGR